MKLSWHNLRYYLGICREGQKRPRKKTGYLVSGPRFEPRTSPLRIKSVNHWTTTFGLNTPVSGHRRRMWSSCCCGSRPIWMQSRTSSARSGCSLQIITASRIPSCRGHPTSDPRIFISELKPREKKLFLLCHNPYGNYETLYGTVI